MATRTITRLYDTYDEATRAAQALEAAGVPHADISVVGSACDRAAEGAGEATADTGRGAGIGATLGTLVGGGAGLVAGIGALPVPGAGPVVAAGWLVAVLTGAGVGAGIGAAAGGLLGSLTGAGVDEEDARVYEEGVRRGGALLAARVEEAEAGRFESVLADGSGDVDIAARRSENRADGWNRFDPAAPAHTTPDVQAKRKRRVRVHGARAAADAAEPYGAESVRRDGSSAGDAPRQAAEANVNANAAGRGGGVGTLQQGGCPAGDAPRQGAEANTVTILQGAEAVPGSTRGDAQAMPESQRRIVQAAAERSERADRESPRAPQGTTKEVHRPVALPNAAEGGPRELQQSMTGLVEDVVQTNLRVAQGLFRLADPVPVFELQQRFARECTDALVWNGATLVRAVRRTADETLRALDEQIQQGGQAAARSRTAAE